MDLGITPFDHLTVKPDYAISIGHGLHKLLLLYHLNKIKHFNRRGAKTQGLFAGFALAEISKNNLFSAPLRLGNCSCITLLMRVLR
jgi:hypothetical protein